MFSILAIFVFGFFLHDDIGGFSEAGQQLWENKPEKFVREGNFTWEIIFSYTILWPITVPMFLSSSLDFILLKMKKPLGLLHGFILPWSPTIPISSYDWSLWKYS